MIPCWKVAMPQARHPTDDHKDPRQAQPPLSLEAQQGAHHVQ